MPRVLRTFVRRLRDPRGANLVEAAILTPLLLLITFGIMDFAIMFYVYLSLENGVSQATRFAVTGNQTAGMTRQESIMRAMREATPTLTIDDSDFQFEYLRPRTAVWLPGIGGPNDVQKLTINYTWSFYTPLVRPFFNDGQVQIQVASAMRNEGRFE